MTERESEILKIIQDDPMVSQNTIADKLGITRSSVSVYINNMTKKGILLGRGYIVNDESYPVVIGSVNLDIIGIYPAVTESYQYFSKGVVENADISIAHGGIAKNVAENLLRLDCNPKVISAIASDVFGNDVLREFREHGIDVDSSLILNDVSSSIILEIRSGNQDRIISGLRSTNISNRLTPAFFKTKHPILKKANQIMLEDKLSRESIEYITSSFRNTPLFFFATTYSLTAQYKDLLNRFSTLLISPDIASILIGDSNPINDLTCAGENVIKKMAYKIIDMGSNAVFLPFGIDKICYADHSDCTIYSSGQTKCQSANYTFYRDIFMAGLMYCRDREYNLEDTLNFLAACRVIATESVNFVNPNMCLALVESQIKEIHGTMKNYKF